MVSRNVGPVINSVLKIKLFISYLVDKQLIILCVKNLTLYGDETRKTGKTYQTFLLSDEDRNLFFLGLRDMYNEASSTILDTFKEILQDVSNAYQELLTDRAQGASKGHHEIL